MKLNTDSLLTSKKIIRACLGGLIVVLLAVLWIVVYSSKQEVVFSEPFNLSLFLKDNLEHIPDKMIDFRVLDTLGDPVRDSLIKFDWSEGGRITFQTDHRGVISMQFEEDFLDSDVIVSAEQKGGKVSILW